MGGPTFRTSQLKDHAFFLANQKEIEQAAREGRIQRDNGPPKTLRDWSVRWS